VFIGFSLVVVVSLLVFSPSIAFAQEDGSRPVILPDSIFYGIKLAIENVREAFIFQEDRKAELILKHAEERDREAEELERQGKMIPIDRLKAIQAEKIMRAEEIIIRLEGIEKTRKDLAEQAQLRQEEFRATSEEERFRIQQQQIENAQRPTLIEPDLSRPSLIEGQMQRVSDQPIQILPVDDIRDTDEPSDIVQKLRDRLTNAFTSSEITEIRAKFSELRTEQDPVRKVFLADRLDDQVNNPIISITCFGNVDTLRLSLAIDPVTDLQQQCPILRPIPIDELRNLANGLN